MSTGPHLQARPISVLELNQWWPVQPTSQHPDLDPSNLGGLICTAQGPGRGQGLALCTGLGTGVERQRTHMQQHLTFVDFNRVLKTSWQVVKILSS